MAIETEKRNSVFSGEFHLELLISRNKIVLVTGDRDKEKCEKRCPEPREIYSD